MPCCNLANTFLSTLVGQPQWFSFQFLDVLCFLLPEGPCTCSFLHLEGEVLLNIQILVNSFHSPGNFLTAWSKSLLLIFTLSLVSFPPCTNFSLNYSFNCISVMIWLSTPATSPDSNDLFIFSMTFNLSENVADSFE